MSMRLRKVVKHISFSLFYSVDYISDIMISLCFDEVQLNGGSILAC